jgi:pentatricopeptide repeat protein
MLQNGICDEALQLFRDMGVAGVMPDSATVVSVLPACAGLEALQQGKEIHHYAIKFRFEFDVDVGSALLTMYSKCGRVDDAERVFHKMSERDVVSWNAMIARYAQNGFFEEAMKFFHQMQQASVKPNRVTIVTILPVCGQLVDLQQGKMIHDCIVGSEFVSDVSIGNALIDMYAKCYSIENAHNLFDMMIKKDVVSWNAMISSYVLNERFVEALRLFHQMGLVGIKPDWVAVVSALCSCARLATFHQDKEVHNYIKRNGFESDVSVVDALIDMYAKCGSLENARQLFDRMLRRDLVSWTVMILGMPCMDVGRKH